jgi:membrane protein implicated in regulation of membrane protease activity
MSFSTFSHEYFLHPVAWMALAAVMGIIEIILPGYLFLGFAAGALAVAVVLFAGLEGWFLGIDGFAYLLVAYAAISLVSWYVFRRLFAPTGDVRKVERDINEDPYKGAKD